MSQPERNNDHWKLGLIAGGAAIAAGLGYYLGTQSHQQNSPHSYSNANNRNTAPRPKHADNSECPEKCSICLSKMKPIQRLNCGHTFHSVCISGWLPQNATCPICRQQQE